jgi:glutathione synthase/RimK-type ligase-like ATP-grasp enzyme
MTIRIAIHESPVTFSDRWIEICRLREMNFACVSGYRTDIISTLRDYDLFLWHYHNWEPLSMMVGPQVMAAAQSMGLKVWPDHNTSRFYNDKIYQRYLLDAVGAPSIQTYVFYDLESALEWIETATFPKILKLRCGRRSRNVKLITDKKEAARVCKVSFREGFYRRKMDESFCYPDYHFGEVIHRRSHSADSRRVNASAYCSDFTKRFLRSIRHPSRLWENLSQRERGYVYFQDFLPGNTFDTRIIVIGNRAFGCVRDNRDDDFRASGSGRVDVNVDRVDLDLVKLSFETAKKMQVQSMAVDYIYDADKMPRIAEINYNFSTGLVERCQGHWDADLNWHEGHSRAEDAILDDLIASATSIKGAGEKHQALQLAISN